MIDYPDIGYTPTNFKALVEATQLSKKDFIDRFDLNRAMFFRHQKGQSTMSYQDWEDFRSKVELYIKQTHPKERG